MRALTLRQPYATLAALGVKQWETRPQPFGYRGPLAIHAAARRPPRVIHWDVNDDLPTAVDLVAMSSCWRWWEHPDDPRHGGVHEWVGPLGCIVGTVDVIDCVPITSPDDADGPVPPCIDVDPDAGTLWLWAGDFDPSRDIADQLPYGTWTPGSWAIQLANPRRLTEPVPCKGSQARPWTVPADVAAAVTAQTAQGTH